MATLTRNNVEIGIQLVAYTGLYKFVWYGGNYVDVFVISKDTAVDLINVWDYELDAPRVAFTPDGLANAVSDWLASQKLGKR